MTTATRIGLLITALLAAPLAAEDRFARKLERAREVVETLLEAPDRSIPAELLEGAECIAIIPAVIKGAIGWGGRHGRGVLSCRDDGSAWSPPAFVKLSGGSFGLQIGLESTDFVLFLMTERSVKSLLRSKFILGGDVSVAAGPLGRSAELGTDVRLNAEIYAYARARGLFAGVSIEGSRLAPDPKAIERFYGERLRAERIVLEHRVPRLSDEAQELLRALP